MRECVAVAIDQIQATFDNNQGEAVIEIHRLIRALAVQIIGATDSSAAKPPGPDTDDSHDTLMLRPTFAHL